ncbi:DUF6382 domain-containing protein [Paenibacillus senegalensis]|uniref:DUF6382 domain-containing protein n=1 Tax=Paenibacillus senegalensis TaxID=1465766 RepID=UPI00028937E1|nr:DUF6382 domain-containing protein [Paenibacillus senegalensis]
MITKELYGLQVNKELEPEADLVFSRSDSPLVKEDMVYVEKRMLENYDVPGVLPVEFEEKDFCIRLRYRLPSGKTLQQALAEIDLTNRVLYEILYALVQILEDSRIYMLNEHRFILRANYIFIGQDVTDFSRLRLIYIPLLELPGKGTVQQDLVTLIDSLVRVSSIVPDAQWKAVRALLTNEISFSLREFKRELEVAMTVQKSHSRGEERVPGRAEENMNVMNVTSNNVNPLPLQEASSFDTVNDVQAADISDEAHNLKIIRALFAAAAIFMLVSWSYYLSDPQDALMYICLGVTLLGLDFLYVLHVKGLLNRDLFQTAAAVQALPSEPNHSAAVQNNQADFENQDPAGRKSPRQHSPEPGSSNQAISVEEWAASRVAMLQEQDQAGDNLGQAAEESRSDNIFPQIKRQQDYYASLAQQTTLLVPQDATTSLADPFLEQEESFLQPILEIERADVTERLPISEYPFRIGRNREGVHFTDSTVGVSRIHLEFILDESHATIYIKDLGSKNGSYLNGEQLIPYQEYELKDQDEIRYAEVKAKFIRPSL